MKDILINDNDYHYIYINPICQQLRHNNENKKQYQ